LLGTQAAAGETAGSPDEPAIAPSALAILAGPSEGGKQAKVPSTNEKKQEQSEKASGAPFTGLGNMPNGLPLDSSSVAILLGGSAARPANPVASGVAKAAIAATSSESSTDTEKEMPLISGVAPKQQPNANAAGG